MKIISILIIALFSANLLFAQTTPTDENQTLQQQILRFYQQGNFDKAIPLAEKVLQLEKKKSTKTPQSLATANYNVALLIKKRLIINKDKFANWQKLDKKQLKQIYKTIDEDAEKAHKHFREVIKIHEIEIERPTLNESLQLASTQNELAWILYNHDFSQEVIRSFERFIQAESLYKSALSKYTSLLGNNADETLSTTFNLAEFHTKRANFEKALPLYQDFISTAKSKYKDDEKTVLPALFAIAKIFVTIGEKDEAVKTIDLISQITKSEEPLPPADQRLNVRVIWKRGSKVSGFRPDAFNSWVTPDPSSFSSRGPTVSSYQTKRILVKITIDEKGEVIDAFSDYKNKRLRNEAIANVKSWNFRPFELDGKKSKMKGYVVYLKTILR